MGKKNEKFDVIIDNDGGTDDFVAILYAFLSKKFNVDGISLVAGNTDVENVKNNVFKALEMAGVTPEEAKKVGIYQPEKTMDTVPDNAQGANGLGDVEYKKAEGYTLEAESAEDMLYKKVMENPGKYSIIATGPLTNIASVLEKDPEFAKNVKELVIMGGDEGGGNITPYAEFNFFQNPQAAKKVFEAGFPSVKMIGFNITKQITFGPEIEKFLQENGEDGKFLYDITRQTADLDRWKNKTDGASMNDIVTLIYLTHPELFKSKKAYVKVNENSEDEKFGQTEIIEPDGATAETDVITEVEVAPILKEMLINLFPEKENEIDEALNCRGERIEIRDKMIKLLPKRKEKIIEAFNSENVDREWYKELEKIMLKENNIGNGNIENICDNINDDFTI